MSVQTVELSLDVLQLAPNTLPAASLGPLMQTAVHAQLDRFQRMLLESDGPLCDLRALHFQPPGWPHQLTVIYPLRGGGAGKASAQPLKGTCGDNVPRGLWTGNWDCSPRMVVTADIAVHVQACCRAFSHPHMMIPDILLSQHISCMLQSLEALEETLLPMRKQLHQLLGLPMDRPMLRMANALAFDAAGEAYLQPAQSPESWYGAGVISAILRLPVSKG